MAKKLVVDIENKEYEFALDRKEIIRAEKIGLKLKEIENNPLTQMSILWTVGLHKLQPTLSNEKALDLMDKYIEEGGDISEVVEFLSNEYASFFQTTQTDTKSLKKARVEQI